MTLTLDALLAEEATRFATIRYLCGIRKDLALAPETDLRLAYSVSVERMCRTWEFEEQQQAFKEGKEKIKSRALQRAAVTPPPVAVEVVQPTASPLTPEKVLGYIKQAIADLKEEEEGDIQVAFSEFLDFVATDHLKNGTYVWDESDSRMSGKTQRWKSLVSSALQKLQDDDIVTHRAKADRWFIFRD